jgi:hypothetical protein
MSLCRATIIVCLLAIDWLGCHRRSFFCSMSSSINRTPPTLKMWAWFAPLRAVGFMNPLLLYQRRRTQTLRCSSCSTTNWPSMAHCFHGPIVGPSDLPAHHSCRLVACLLDDGVCILSMSRPSAAFAGLFFRIVAPVSTGLLSLLALSLVEAKPL